MGVAIKFGWPRSANPERVPEGRRKSSRGAKAGREQDGQQRNSRQRRAAATQSRRGAQAKGATRRAATVAAKPRRLSAWLNRILVLVGAGVVLVAALQGWITLQAIPVERITVTGEMNHTRTTAVQDMVQPALAGGFLGADLQKVREQLEALPWIYEASVRRVWPSALEIHVVEQLPIARWGDSAFLNHEGAVFRPSDTSSWQSLPLLSGPDGQAGVLMDYYQRLLDLLAPLGLGVAQLAMDERGEIRAALSGGQQVLIGSSDFLERMHRFATVYRAELAGRMEDVERVDLRYERGVAVAFSEAEPEQQTAAASEEA